MYLYLKPPDVYLEIGPEESPFAAAHGWFNANWPDPHRAVVIVVARRTPDGQERMFRFLAANGRVRSLRRTDAECDLCGQMAMANDLFQGGLAVHSLGRRFILIGMFCEECHRDLALVSHDELTEEGGPWLKPGASEGDTPILGELDAPEVIRVCDAPGLARVLVANARERPLEEDQGRGF
jgi:hypothetical protein